MLKTQTAPDIENPQELQAYLKKKTGPFDPAKFHSHIISGGVSNKTVLVDLGDSRRWVLKQALPKLRVKADWFCDPSRIFAEAEGIRALSGIVVPGQVPGLVFEDKANFILAMLAVPEPHDNFKTLLLSPQNTPHETLLALSTQAGQILGTIHESAYAKASRLAKRFADRKFFEALRIQPYYVSATQKCPRSESFIRHVIAETRQRTLTLTHGDYSPKNMLVRAGNLVLLDHEVIHWGDPAFDVAFFLTHLMSKARHLPEHRALFFELAAKFTETYFNTTPTLSKTHDVQKASARSLLALMLARVDGRSPVEYLTPEQQDAQREQVVALMLDKETRDLKLPQVLQKLQETMA
jgi:5-methylthioribose kinase